MVSEDYVSFEVAKLLKEKGFDVPCGSYYDYFSSNVTMYQGYVPEFSGSCTNHNGRGNHDVFSRPTQQMALAWLREEKNIFIDICTLSLMSYCYRVALVSDTTGHLYEDYACEEGERFMNYEEAVDAALSYVLENILEE